MEQVRKRISGTPTPPILSAVADFWWVRLPAAAGRLWRPAAGLLSDGIALGVWPLATALAPPAAFLIGLLIAWPYLNAGAPYTSSVPALALMLAVASVGLALGIWVWLGYVVADSFLCVHPLTGYPWLERFLRVRGSLLVAYLLLAVLLIGLPLASRALSGLAVAGLRPGRVRRTVSLVVQSLLLGAMVYAWTQAAPMLIHPVFTWRKVTPPAGAGVSLIDRGWLLPLVAMAVCAARLREVRRALVYPAVQRRLLLLKQAAATWRRGESLPTWLSASIRAGLMTLVLSGLFGGWLDAIVCLVFLTMIRLAQSDWLGKLVFWTKAVAYLPTGVRLLLGLVIGFALSRPILAAGRASDTYRPLLLCLAVTMTTVALLVPKPAESSTAGGRMKSAARGGAGA